MNESLPSYAVITPARNEADNLPRLAAGLRTQTHLPAEWLIVENASTDDTRAFAGGLADEVAWARLTTVRGDQSRVRGPAVVKAFQAGVAALASKPDVVVKLDADLSIEPRYFERLMREFAVDHRLGIASGIAYEEENGRWVARHMTRTSVWGACRAYRWECLQDVLPLEARMGWDAVDEFKANIRGWSTRTVPELPFRHHRVEGERDGNRRAVWAIEGETAHYLGYRPSYLLTRSLFRARREPAALAMAGAYLKAVLRREPRCSDRDAVAYLRERQRLRELPSRIAEALGRPVGVS